MGSSAVRRLVIVLGAVLLAFVAFVLALPLIASTQLVRDRIALELSVWSGYRVELREAPELALWPSFRARLGDVSFHRWDGTGEPPVISAEGIEAGLSAFAALSGDVVFTQLTLKRPSIHIWSSDIPLARADPNPSGRIRQSIESARALIADNPGNPDLSQLPGDSLGVVEFSDGRVTVHDEDGDTEILTSVSGRISWPALNRSLTASASGIWRGEVVRLEAGADRPLMLVAGGKSPARISISSALLNASFAGDATLASGSYLDGTATMSSPSLRRLLEWSRREIVPGAAIASISIEGRMSGNMDRLRINDAALVLDGSRATGTLEIEPRKAIPSIAGTLAFENFDMQSFLSAFSALTPDPWGRWRTLDDSISDQIGMDLRLSAARASAGTVTFQDLAATAQIRKGIAAFDISDARVFGGNVQAGMRVDRSAGGTEVEVRLRGENIDMGVLARAMQVQYLVPVARGTFTVSLRGRGNELYNVIATSSGVVSATFGPGAMAGIDLAAFRKRAGSGEFFPLSAVGGGTLAFSALEMKAVVENGTARIEKALVKTPEGNVSVNGVVPLPGAGLALAGNLTPAGDGQPTPFFVGGSWQSPYISPIAPQMQ